MTPLQQAEADFSAMMPLCDCERSHNGLGIVGRECDCPAGLYPEILRLRAAHAAAVAEVARLSRVDDGMVVRATMKFREQTQLADDFDSMRAALEAAMTGRE